MHTHIYEYYNLTMGKELNKQNEMCPRCGHCKTVTIGKKLKEWEVRFISY